jgi:hypothetical protein
VLIAGTVVNSAVTGLLPTSSQYFSAPATGVQEKVRSSAGAIDVLRDEDASLPPHGRPDLGRNASTA